MKKIKSIVLIIVMCLMLCSCDAIDEMKNCHALDYGDGTIKLNNHIYKRLDLDFDGYIVYNPGRDIWITEPDVPVLLSQTDFIKYLPNVSADETIIIGYDENFGHYIREDKYDYYINSIKNGIDYSRFYCCGLGYRSNYPEYYFSDSQSKEFKNFLASVSYEKSNEGIYTDDYVWISCESTDGIFRTDCMYQLVKTDDGFCLLDYSDDGYYNRYDSTHEYDKLFANIFKSVETKE